MNETTISSIREAADDKSNELSEFFAEIQESVKPESIGLTLNTLFLADACESCFIDLERHKDFHGIDMADRHKRAAFLFKWLAKIRPINVLAYKKGPGKGKAVRINAYFALLSALGELKINMRKFAPTEIARHAIYAASYRDINAQNWAITFCLLEMAFPALESKTPAQPGRSNRI